MPQESRPSVIENSVLVSPLQRIESPDPPPAGFLVPACLVPSGPMRFEFHDDTKRWLNTRDGATELRAILAAEMSEKCGVSLQ